MTVLELLVAARKLIAKPENWTCGVAARDEWECPVSSESPYAVKFCAFGALTHAVEWMSEPDTTNQAVLILQAHLPECVLPMNLADYNDACTHAEILAVFDRAIASQREIETLQFVPAISDLEDARTSVTV